MKTPDRQFPAPELLMLAGFPVLCLTRDQLRSRLLEGLSQGGQRALFFVNTNFVNHCGELQAQLDDDTVTLVNDGVGMDLAAWLIHGQGFPDNLNGTDFVPFLLRGAGGAATPPLRVFLLGGRPGIAARAADALADQEVTVAGHANGFDEAADSDSLVRRINASDADVVLVAMGNPRQERWILAHRSQLRAQLLVGVGALLDFLAGDKPRAPVWVQRWRLEWLYRLSLEPRRLLRRYTIDIVAFLVRCWRRRGEPMKPQSVDARRSDYR